MTPLPGAELVRTPLQLYRYLLRCCKLLPSAAVQTHYRHTVRQDNDPKLKQDIYKTMAVNKTQTDFLRTFLGGRRKPENRRENMQNWIRAQKQSTTNQSYNSHADEDDPDRIRAIVQRAISDADWILNKYIKKTGPPGQDATAQNNSDRS